MVVLGHTPQDASYLYMGMAIYQTIISVLSANKLFVIPFALSFTYWFIAFRDETKRSTDIPEKTLGKILIFCLIFILLILGVRDNSKFRIFSVQLNQNEMKSHAENSNIQEFKRITKVISTEEYIEKTSKSPGLTGVDANFESIKFPYFFYFIITAVDQTIFQTIKMFNSSFVAVPNYNTLRVSCEIGSSLNQVMGTKIAIQWQSFLKKFWDFGMRRVALKGGKKELNLSYYFKDGIYPYDGHPLIKELALRAEAHEELNSVGKPSSTWSEYSSLYKEWEELKETIDTWAEDNQTEDGWYNYSRIDWKDPDTFYFLLKEDAQETWEKQSSLSKNLEGASANMHEVLKWFGKFFGIRIGYLGAALVDGIVQTVLPTFQSIFSGFLIGSSAFLVFFMLLPFSKPSDMIVKWAKLYLSVRMWPLLWAMNDKMFQTGCNIHEYQQEGIPTYLAIVYVAFYVSAPILSYSLLNFNPMGLTAAIGFGLEKAKRGAEIAGGVVMSGANKAAAPTASAFQSVANSIPGVSQMSSGIKNNFNKANNLVANKTKKLNQEGQKGSISPIKGKNLSNHNKSSSNFSNKKGE